MSNSPTVLSHLHTLLTTLRQQAPLPYAPFLHPYAPAGKGKAREDGRDVSRLFRELRDGIEGVRVVLGGDAQQPTHGDREKERTRLGRVMKELSTHQAALLPLLSNLGNLPTTTASAMPFAVSSLSPTDLLLTLGAAVTLDCFSEPSQFGMQGDSLVLAGKSIVIDIVLENAQMEGDGPSSSKVQEGTIKLVKVSVSHATADGETKKSDCILQVLQARIEAILSIWNGDGQDGESRELRLAKAVTALKLELEDIVFLDGITAEGSRDWLSDVDGMHRGLAQLVDASAASESFRLYSAATPTVLPTFHLLPLAIPSPRLQLRPVTAIESPFSPLDDPGIAAMDSQWEGWSIDISPGVVVGASFFPGDAPTTFAPFSERLTVQDLMFTSPDAFISRMPLGTHHMSPPFASFPTSDADNLFLHEGERDQRWSLSDDRSEGFVVGRFGVSSWATVAALAKALTPAVVLETLFRSVFNAEARLRAQGKDVESEAEFEDLDAFLNDDAAADLAVSASLGHDKLVISFPLGSQSHTIELKTTPCPPFVSEDALTTGLVELVAQADKRPTINSKRKRSDASDEPEKKARMES